MWCLIDIVGLLVIDVISFVKLCWSSIFILLIVIVVFVYVCCVFGLLVVFVLLLVDMCVVVQLVKLLSVFCSVLMYDVYIVCMKICVNGSLNSGVLLIVSLGFVFIILLIVLCVWYVGMNVLLMMMLWLFVVCRLSMFQFCLIWQLVFGSRKVWYLGGWLVLVGGISVLRNIYLYSLLLFENFQWFDSWKLLFIGVMWLIGMQVDVISVVGLLFYMFCCVCLLNSVSCQLCMLMMLYIYVVDMQLCVSVIWILKKVCGLSLQLL